MRKESSPAAILFEQRPKWTSDLLCHSMPSLILHTTMLSYLMSGFLIIKNSPPPASVRPSTPAEQCVCACVCVCAYRGLYRLLQDRSQVQRGSFNNVKSRGLLKMSHLWPSSSLRSCPPAAWPSLHQAHLCLGCRWLEQTGTKRSGKGRLIEIVRRWETPGGVWLKKQTGKEGLENQKSISKRA